MNLQSYIFIGRSGCGKGTQAKLLAEYLKKKDIDAGTPHDVLYVQSGDEFRNFIKGTSHSAKLSNEISLTGGLQPEFLAVYMWVSVLINKYTGNEHLIFDGMPRKLHEAGVLHSIFGFYGLSRPTVIYINVSEDWSVKHLMGRGRADDTETEIRERLSWFGKEVVPAIEYYKKSGEYAFVEINGEQPIEAVWKDIVSKIS
jgi:adenylate kinase